MLFGCVSNTDLVSHLLASGCGTFLWYLSKPMSAPPFHSSLLLSVIPPVSPSSSPMTSRSPQEVKFSKMGRFFFSSSPSVSLVSFSLSQISIEKEKKNTPNLNAEWLIQIIVALTVSSYSFLWLPFCFSSFPQYSAVSGPLVNWGLWVKRQEKTSDIRDGEKERDLKSPCNFLFCFYDCIYDHNRQPVSWFTLYVYIYITLAKMSHVSVFYFSMFALLVCLGGAWHCWLLQEDSFTGVLFITE